MPRITAGLRDEVTNTTLSELIALDLQGTRVEVRRRTLIVTTQHTERWLEHLGLASFRWINVNLEE